MVLWEDGAEATIDTRGGEPGDDADIDALAASAQAGER